MKDRMNWYEWLQCSPGWYAKLPTTIGQGDTSLVAFGVKTLKAMGVPIQRRSICELMDRLRDPNGDPDRTRFAIIALGDFGPSAAEAVPVLGDIIRAGRRPSAVPRKASPTRIRPEPWRQRPWARSAGKVTRRRWPCWPAWSRPRVVFGSTSRVRTCTPGAEGAFGGACAVNALEDPRDRVRSSARDALARIGVE